jgi:ketosteroid isomerase-like protein
MKIDDYMAVPEDRRAVCRSSMTAQTAVGPFSNEYVWFFKFDESGKKIVEIAEFFDGIAARDILGRFKEAGLVKPH